MTFEGYLERVVCFKIIVNNWSYKSCCICIVLPCPHASACTWRQTKTKTSLQTHLLQQSADCSAHHICQVFRRAPNLRYIRVMESDTCIGKHDQIHCQEKQSQIFAIIREICSLSSRNASSVAPGRQLRLSHPLPALPQVYLQLI